MKPEPSIFEQIDEEADARRYAEAMADIAAGHVIPNEDVCTWLETWGRPEEQPAPKSWFK
jgi:predicted transcriptional regulator